MVLLVSLRPSSQRGPFFWRSDEVVCCVSSDSVIDMTPPPDLSRSFICHNHHRRFCRGLAFRMFLRRILLSPPFHRHCWHPVLVSKKKKKNQQTALHLNDIRWLCYKYVFRENWYANEHICIRPVAWAVVLACSLRVFEWRYSHMSFDILIEFQFPFARLGGRKKEKRARRHTREESGYHRLLGGTK